MSGGAPRIASTSKGRQPGSVVTRQGDPQRKTQEGEGVNGSIGPIPIDKEEAIDEATSTQAPTQLLEKEKHPSSDTTPTRRPAPPPSAGAMELKRENEQLKAKIRAMEAKLKDNRDEMITLRKEKEEKAKLETIVQKLKQKIQPQQQENAELRSRFEDVEARYAKLEDETEAKSLEYESIFLDKEVALEQAADLEMQLQALENRQAEMDEEIEILRLENQELTADVSPEDKASINWIHMMQENERLQKALRMLRELQQENELEMKAEIKELNAEVSELETFKDELETTKEKLDQTEMARQMLKDQVDSLEEAEDTFLHQEEKLHNKETELAQLQNDVDYLKAIGETNDDLIQSYETDIIQLNGEIDDRNARLAEHFREMAKQRQAIEDLEFVMGKFRTLVTDYQKREEDLRASQEISEAEAGDMMAKSRAIMDLNLKLQNSAAKHQLRSIDMELRRLKAEEASEHLAIVQLFLPATFETEKIPIAAFLCFKRISFKANLVQQLLREELETEARALSDESWLILDIVEKLLNVFAFCDRFVKYINTCDAEDFRKFEGALFEIEPLERQLNVWIDELRGDGLSKSRCNNELTGSLAFFSDLTEKLLPSNAETRAHAMTAHSSLLISLVENVGIELDILRSSIGTVPDQRSDDEGDESDITYKQLEKLSSKVRSVKVLAGKAFRNLAELGSRNLVLDEDVSMAFEQVESLAQELSRFARCLMEEVQKYLNDDARTEAQSTAQMLSSLSRPTTSFLQSSPVAKLLSNIPDDAITALSQVSDLLLNMVEKMASQTMDYQFSTEIEPNQHPWVLRAHAMKSNTMIAPDTEALIARLRDNLAEQSNTLTDKNKSLDEQNLRIELLESRTKDTKEQATIVKGLETELERAKRERDDTVGRHDAAKAEFRNLQHERDQLHAELEVLNQQTKHDGTRGIGNLGARDLLQLRAATAEAERLRNEASHLQAAIRYLREENRRARLPPNPNDAVEHAWLSAPLRPSAASLNSERKKATAAQCERAFDELFRVAQRIKPVSLEPRTLDVVNSEHTSMWRPLKSTPRYHSLKQKEELQRWWDIKEDIVTTRRGQRRSPALPHNETRYTDLFLGKAREIGEVKIVGSPP